MAAVELGDPNPGLSAAEQQAFERGRLVFERRFRRSEGHGPDFNTTSCRSCHEFPVSGGSSPLYRNFYIVGRTELGRMVPVLDDNQIVARAFSYERRMREAIPPTADIVAQRNAPPMFGLGVLARIPANDVLVNQDPIDSDGDGISGVANFDGALLGRFGYKAQEGDLIDFIRGPLFNHLGITTDPLPPNLPLGSIPQASAPSESTTDDDLVPDPELPESDLADLLVFTRELAPPRPLPLDGQGLRGREVFREVGCAKCHIPNLVSSGEPVLAYTDLLLHDMGPELADGVTMGRATGAEFRTAPLWGLRHHAPYLHDGRADTIDDAVRLHGGEAQGVRDAYAALVDSDRAALIRFLETR